MRSPLSVGLPRWYRGKECTCPCRRCKTLGFNPWVEKIPWRRNGNPLQYSCLTNSMDRGAWWATAQAVSKSCTWLSDQEHKHTRTHTHTHTPLSVLYNVHPWHPGPQSQPFAYVNQSKSRPYYNERSPHTGQNGHQSKSLQTMNAGEGVEKKREPSYAIGRNVNRCSHHGEQYAVSFKN